MLIKHLTQTPDVDGLNPVFGNVITKATVSYTHLTLPTVVVCPLRWLVLIALLRL